jgi:predicted 3-demethylubiquinone-9 3-methyltransferase (glyoxalase superfamily)
MQTTTTQKITTFLMFEGKAEEAIKLYTSAFKDSEILKLVRYGKEGPGDEGTIQKAHFSLNGQEFMAIDSPVKHAFGFTPSVSLFVHCNSEQEVEDLYTKLSEGGKVLMPLDKYPFSDKFCWITDKYGVSWQFSKS